MSVYSAGSPESKVPCPSPSAVRGTGGGRWMCPEPTVNTTGLPGSEPGTRAVSPGAEDSSWHWFYSEPAHIQALFLVTILVNLLGLVGNGTVIWLLGFSVKRNPYSVYILNLACADFLFLISSMLEHILRHINVHYPYIYEIVCSAMFSFFPAGHYLLMAVSTERCVSVLCPMWYRCRRPTHLSSVLCALIWVLGSCIGIAYFLCLRHDCDEVILVFSVTSILTCLVLCVSSLTLLLRVRCCSRRRWPGRLYLTILLTVLAFLLLGVPYGVLIIALTFRASFILDSVLFLTFYLLGVLNSVVNPFIYFFVGRCRQPQGRKPLREVLQSALIPEEEEEEEEEGEQGRGA